MPMVAVVLLGGASIALAVGVLLGTRNPERSAELARSLRLALEEAGPTFVKLGQLLSTRPDLLPLPVVEELGRLQSQVAPAPWGRSNR